MAAFKLKLRDSSRSALFSAIMRSKFPWDAAASMRLEAEKEVKNAVWTALVFHLGSGYPINITRLSFGTRVSQAQAAGYMLPDNNFVNVTFERDGHIHWAYCYV